MSTIDSLADAVRLAATDRARYEQLTAQLDAATALQQLRQRELADLQDRLRIERADVRALERVSPTRIWAVLRGTAEERLAVEQAEAAAAEYAAAGAQSRLDHAAVDADRVRSERAALGDVAAAYDRALAAYEVGLHARGGAVAAQLTRVATALGEAAAERREIAEATAALQIALTALDRATTKLSSAGGWATYDTFFGGGLIGDLVKHSSMSDAAAEFTQVNRALERLSTELADIDAPPLAGIQVSETLAVFDVLFDNILSDWMVRDRIAQARGRADDLRTRLGDLSGYLARRAEGLAARIDDLLRQRVALLDPVAPQDE